MVVRSLNLWFHEKMLHVFPFTRPHRRCYLIWCCDAITSLGPASYRRVKGSISFTIRSSSPRGHPPDRSHPRRFWEFLLDPLLRRCVKGFQQRTFNSSASLSCSDYGSSRIQGWSPCSSGGTKGRCLGCGLLLGRVGPLHGREWALGSA